MNGLGGAIDWVASSGYIIDSEFTSNCADYGGGVYFGGKSDKSVITNCVFTDNHAKYNGGAIDCNASSMYLTNTLFDGNYAQFGAALCRETHAKSGSGENNTFKNNHAYVSGAALGWMGLVGIKITNYTFINNSADVSGGAIYVSPDSHNCSVIDCNFVDNYVSNKTIEWNDQFNWIAWDGTEMTYTIQYLDKGDPLINKTRMYPKETVFYYEVNTYPEELAVGGAMNILASNATIKNTNFTGNTARLGGGIYVGAESGNTIINVSVWRNNVAYERGGAINLHASGVHIDDGKFYDNLAINGSALYVGGVGTENKVHESIFVGNNATGYGGGIYWIAHEGEIVNSSFTRNLAEYGGGIYLDGRSSNTNITNTNFTSNTALKNGGAIECNATHVGIYNLIFDSNIAGEYGAALCREIGATSGNGSHNLFKNNHAGIAGAALAWMGVDNIHIIDYTFIDNTAGDSGGAIYIAEGSDNDIIENCTFEGNHLTNMSDFHYGGAIDCRGENLTIDTVIFTNNGAFTGGAIYVGTFSKDVHIFDSNFTSNYAYGDGGAIGFKASSLSINNTIFKSNTAVRHGGALYAGGTGTNNTIYYSSFEYNTAGDHGGAIDWLASAGIFKYINFIGNEANYGGALYLNGVSSNSSLETIYFRANRATMNGGAIDCNASMMGLNNVLFEENVAGEYGGALCREANATGGYGGNNTFIRNHADIGGAALAWLGVDGININKYRFINNTADLYGGAIYVRGDSPNCKVRNSYFDNNYIIDIRRGQGGTIYWLGENATVLNTTFLNSFATEGGTLYIGGDNANITKSNFSYSAAFVNGGAISGHNAKNASITDCIFNKNVGSGYLDSSNRVYGSGGVIYWENATNLNFLNLKIIDTESHSNGALSLVNCNDSKIYNVTFKGAITIRDGGSISWVNSTNGIIDLCNFLDSAASYNGGAIFLYNIDNFNVSNSNFSNTHALYGNGGGIFVNGNATFNNLSFEKYMAAEDYAGGIFVYAGNSTIANSKFNGPDAIWVNESAIAYLINNYITGSNPNKNITYLEKPYDARYNKYDYAVWNDGDLYLYNNTFDYLIFNNGTIWTNTTTWILNNQTWNETWNETFTFFANITDDNNNTIISVHTLDTWNDVFPDDPHYLMPYNALVNTRMIYQGNFTIFGQDSGLKKNTVYFGHVNVKMPTELTVTYNKEHDEKIDFSVRISVPVQSNYTFDSNKLVIKINDQVIPNADIIFSGLGDKWNVVYANFTRTHMRVGTYTITAEYMGDTFHEASQNSTGLVLFSRPIWVKVHADNIFYGQTLIVNINSNATNTENGRVIITIDGREVSIPLHLNSDGSLVYRLPNENYTSLIEPGNHIISVRFYNGTYYGEQTNYSFFNVFKLDTPLNVNYTNITYGENELINVTVNKTATGYIALRIGENVYVAIIRDGIARFNIQNLPAGTYNATITFPGDNHFNANATNITFKVGPTDDFTINVKVDNITYGENATVRVLVATDAIGNVTIYVDRVNRGTVNLTNGVATLVVPGLVGGQHVVNVTYNGGPRYAPKDNNTIFAVNPNPSWKVDVTHVEYKPYGEYSTINVTGIPKDILGDNITIRIDNVDYIIPINKTTGTANLRLNNLSAGPHSGFVIYDGDANYKNISQVIRPNIPQAVPTIKLIQNGTDVIATVSGNTTGNVTFYTRGKEYTINLVNGNATLKNNLTFGLNDVVAIYNGDKNYTSARTMETFEIEKQNVTIDIKDITSIIYVGNKVIFNATLNETVTGDVIFTINGANYTVNVVNARFATCEYTPVNNKTLTVVATFTGNDMYNGNSTSKDFVVNRVPTDVSVDVKVPVTYGGVAVITVTMDPSINATVKVKVDGITYDVVVVDGKGKLNVSDLNADNYDVNVTYAGDNRYAPSINDTVSFTVNPADLAADVTGLNVTVEQNTSFVINVTDDFKGNVSINLQAIMSLLWYSMVTVIIIN